MKNKSKPTSLQQARKNSGLSLSDVAQLLITDVSNLSKYERGIRTPSAEIILDYHMLTGASLDTLFQEHMKRSFKFVSYQLEQKVAQLRDGMRCMKTDSLIASLNSCIDRLSCLQDKSKNGEHEI